MSTNIDISQLIWIPDDKTCYELARIVHDHVIFPDETVEKIVVETLDDKRKEKKFLRSEVYDVDKSHIKDLNDLIEMNSIHEAPLLDILRKRWFKEKMYTYTGDFLVSINPYHQIPGLNSEPLQYLDLSPSYEKKKKLPPHVYGIANHALREILKPPPAEEDEDIVKISQSIIVTGESGAGKTEAAKQVMNFLTLANKQMSPSAGKIADAIKNVILDSNALFEAFGNAKTVRNDNSSRFGKYIRLEYTQDNQLFAADTETFLLEKSRLVSVGKNDRNYHIFYQMIRGLDDTSKARLHLGKPEDFKILNGGGCTVITTEQDDIDEFSNVSKAFSEMSCSNEEVTRLWELLASVLHLGNVEVKPAAADGETCQLELPTMQLDDITKLLGVTVEAFKRALTIQKVEVKMRNEKYDKILSVDDTKNNILALIKWLYGAAFNWLVSKVNAAHKSIADQEHRQVVKFIGILDIFGFEIFQDNTFEQLCINYTNERLQQQFNELAFELEQQEYAKEGLDWTTIKYRDNQVLIDLIGKKPKGLLIILEEHSLMNREPDDQALLNTYHKHHFNTHPNYAKAKFGNEGFVIKHFAGEVTYNIGGFITKNNDSLQDDLSTLLATSTNSYIHEILKSEVKPMETLAATSSDDLTTPSAKLGGTRMAATISVSYRFRHQLDRLIATLRSTNAFYIKCIKPNNDKSAQIFDANLVITQLRYSGVLEIVRIRREGYPTRFLYSEFYNEYKDLAKEKNWPHDASKCTKQQLKQYCKQLCEQFVPTPESYKLGNKYLFLHHYVPNIMMTALYKEKMRLATIIQSAYRRYRQRKKYLKEIVIVRQEKKEKICATSIQAIVRSRQQQKKYIAEKTAIKYANDVKKAIKLQAVIRGHIKRKEKIIENSIQSITKIQAFIRTIPAKKQLAQLKYEAREKASKRLQAAAKRFLLNTRLRNHTRAFHELCKHANALSDGTELVKECITNNPHYYRNKWYYYCTMYHSAAMGGQTELLQALSLRPYDILEKDILDNRILHHACTYPTLSVIKLLTSTINNIKTSLNIQLDATDDDTEEDDTNNLADANVTTDVMTGLPILKAGWLKKSSTILGFKTYKRRWCVLTEESFILYRSINKGPAGYISIEGCIIERQNTTDTLISIRRPDINPTIKKSLFSSDAAHASYTMKADNETGTQEWLTALKLAAGVRPFRDGPVHYINLNIRNQYVRQLNKNGQSALHYLAQIKPPVDRSDENNMIQVASWLVENGCPIDLVDKDGKTCMDYAKLASNVALIEFLTKRTENITKNTSNTQTHKRMVTSILCKKDHSTATTTEGKKDSTTTPTSTSTNATAGISNISDTLKLKGFSYLQVHLERFRYLDTKMFDLTKWKDPRLSITVVNEQNEPIEMVQEIDTPAYITTDTIYWGYTWYMQTPLENISEGFGILIKVLYDTSSIGAVLRYSLNKATIDSGILKLDLSSSQAANAAVAVTTRRSSLAVNENHLSGLTDSILETEFQISKHFRNLDIDAILKDPPTEQKFPYIPTNKDLISTVASLHSLNTAVAALSIQTTTSQTTGSSELTIEALAALEAASPMLQQGTLSISSSREQPTSSSSNRPPSSPPKPPRSSRSSQQSDSFKASASTLPVPVPTDASLKSPTSPLLDREPSCTSVTHDTVPVTTTATAETGATVVDNEEHKEATREPNVNVHGGDSSSNETKEEENVPSNEPLVINENNESKQESTEETAHTSELEPSSEAVSSSTESTNQTTTVANASNSETTQDSDTQDKTKDTHEDSTPSTAPQTEASQPPVTTEIQTQESSIEEESTTDDKISTKETADNTEIKHTSSSAPATESSTQSIKEENTVKPSPETVSSKPTTATATAVSEQHVTSTPSSSSTTTPTLLENAIVPDSTPVTAVSTSMNGDQTIENGSIKAPLTDSTKDVNPTENTTTVASDTNTSTTTNNNSTEAAHVHVHTPNVPVIPTTEVQSNDVRDSTLTATGRSEVPDTDTWRDTSSVKASLEETSNKQ